MQIKMIPCWISNSHGGKKYNVYFAFRVTRPCFVLCVQIAAATIGNANILLQIDNSKLAADDFKNK